jgi:hypothetical protein
MLLRITKVMRTVRDKKERKEGSQNGSQEKEKSS